MHCAERSKHAERLLIGGIVAVGLIAVTAVTLVTQPASADQAHVTKVDGTTETYADVADVFTRLETGQHVIRFETGEADDIEYVGEVTIRRIPDARHAAAGDGR